MEMKRGIFQGKKVEISRTAMKIFTMKRVDRTDGNRK